MPTWVKWMLRGAEILAAATVLLVLMQLHTAIIENALTMMGARTDAPLIFAIQDRCGTDEIIRHVPIARRDDRGAAAPLVVCRHDVGVITTAPLGQEFALLLNDRVVRDESTRAPLTNFGSVQLRSGVNRLFLVDANARVDFPNTQFSREYSLDDDRSSGRYSSTIWGRVPLPPVSPYAVRLVVKDEGSAAQQRHGPWSAKANKWLLVQGVPGDRIQTEPGQRLGSLDRIGSDGFAFVRQADDASATAWPDLPWQRRLTLRRVGESGPDAHARGLQAEIKACLPPDHPLIDWARNGAIDAPEFILRLTGIYLSGFVRFGDQARKANPVIITEQQPGSACVPLEAEYRIADGDLREWPFNNTFLQFAGDRLVVEGLTQALTILGRPPDERDADHMVWHGVTDPHQRQPWLRTTVESRLSAARRPTIDTEQGPQAPGERRQGMLAWLQSLSESLPSIFWQLLWGIAIAAPVALIHWALGRHRAASPRPLCIDKARAGLLALIAFMAALALHPTLLALSRLLVDVAGILPFFVVDARVDLYFTLSFAPIAFVVVLLIRGLLHQQPFVSPLAASGWPRIPAAVATLLLIVVAIGVSLVERWLVTDPATVRLGALSELRQWIGAAIGGLGLSVPAAIAALVGGWCVFGLLTFWLPVYWLTRSALRGGRVVRAVYVAAMLAFFVPLLSPAAEAARIFLAAASGSYSEVSPGAALLTSFAAVSSVASVVLMVALVLAGFRQIAAAMLAPSLWRRLDAYTGKMVLLVLAVLIVWPATATLASIETVNLRLLQLMTIFQAYGVLIAVLAPLTALRLLDISRRSRDFDTRFRLEDGVVLLLTAVFAGYLTLWVRDPFGVGILLVVGWVTFFYGVIGPAPATRGDPEPDLARRIVAHRAESRLIAARRKTFDQEYTEGKIDAQDLAAKRAALETQAKLAQKALGQPIEEAKRRLLGYGPGASPLSNGYLGAIAGLIAAALFQAILPIKLTPGTSGEASGWLALLHTFIVDPNYRPVQAAADVSRVLAIVGELLNAFSIWVFLGFLFGYAFHRIRGIDGFTKAIVFGAGIAVTFLVSQAVLARGSGVPIERLAPFLPIFTFLIVLGTLVFDGRSVEKQGAGLTDLPDIYGIGTSIGYASFAGIIAAVQPVVQFFKK